MPPRTLRISDALSLPLDIVTMRVAIYGDSGAGKTTFARLFAEQTYAAGQRFVAIDLKNDWHGLKSSADGQMAGIPVVVFGGPRADVRLVEDAAAARALADTIASIDQSVVLDLDGMSRTKQEKFLAPFLDALYEANRRPLLLFCDEADRYAPQKPMSQEALMSLSSSEDIARRGRKRGIGSVWLTQRTAVLNKNVSEFANLTAVFRTPGEKDLRELEDRVGRIAGKDTVKEVMRMAPGLADGEAIFLSAHPKLRPFMPDPVRPIQLPMPWTFDSSATPAVGQRRKEPKVLAKTDLAAIEQRMADQVQQAKAMDPAALKAEVARLRAELAKAASAKPAPPPASEPTRVEVPVLKDGQLARAEKLAERAAALAAELTAASAEIATAIGKTRTSASVPARPVVPARAHGAPRAPAPPREVKPPPEGLDWMQPAHGKILNALRWLEAFGIARPDRGVVAALAGVSPSSSSYATNVSRLNTAGLIRYPKQGEIELTDQGAAIATAPEVAPTIEALHQAWRDCPAFDPAHVRILDAVLARYPNAMTREELAEAAGTTASSSSFANNVSRLSSLGLVEYPDKGQVRATKLLFPEGLR